jgi:hypothetical protein
MRARRHVVAQSGQRRRVGRPDRADDDRLAVPEQAVKLLCRRISSRHRRGVPDRIHSSHGYLLGR